MNTNSSTGKKLSSGKIILLVCVVLAVAVGIFALLNSGLAKEKSQLSLAGEISVLQGGKEAARITPKDLEAIKAETFTATQKSSGNDPVERSFTGVPLVELLDAQKLSLQDTKNVLLRSVDGYSVTLSPAEVSDRDNVWLVWEADGQPLDSSTGPYMVIIRKDPFSQRWSKMLCEIELAPA